MTTGLMNAIAKQFKQFGHAGLELLRVRQSGVSNAVEHRATATEQATQSAPTPEPGHAECCGSQTFAPYRHVQSRS